MKKKSWRIINVLCCISVVGIARGNQEDVYGWVNAGLGYSSLGSLGGVASLNVQHKRLLFGIRGSANSESVEFLGGGDEMFDLGLLIGGVLKRQAVILTLSTGIARVSGSRYYRVGGSFEGGYRERISPLLGIPLEIQIIIPFSEKFGVGAYGYLNLNRERTFSGIAASLVIGTLE